MNKVWLLLNVGLFCCLHLAEALGESPDLEIENDSVVEMIRMSRTGILGANPPQFRHRFALKRNGEIKRYFKKNQQAEKFIDVVGKLEKPVMFSVLKMVVQYPLEQVTRPDQLVKLPDPWLAQYHPELPPVCLEPSIQIVVRQPNGQGTLAFFGYPCEGTDQYYNKGFTNGQITIQTGYQLRQLIFALLSLQNLADETPLYRIDSANE